MKYEIEVTSKTRAELIDITPQVQTCIRQSGVQSGTCFLFLPHTTAGLTVNENWDRSVKVDLLMALDELVPWAASYHHTEGNAAAHIKASLLGASQVMFVEGGTLVLGTWQGIFLAEFDGPRRRQVLLRVIPDVEGS